MPQGKTAEDPLLAKINKQKKTPHNIQNRILLQQLKTKNLGAGCRTSQCEVPLTYTEPGLLEPPHREVTERERPQVAGTSREGPELALLPAPARRRCTWGHARPPSHPAGQAVDSCASSGGCRRPWQGHPGEL